MHKPLPRAVFNEIRPPNDKYHYFEDMEDHEFNDQAVDFDLVNAGWLADFAMLAYGKEAFIKAKLDLHKLTKAGFILRYFSENTTQCFVVHNAKFVVLSLRGTEIDNFYGALMDWIVNLDFILTPDESGGLVHDGFQNDIKNVWPSVRIYLDSLLAPGTNRTLWITGHSLGAALATLAAERAKREGGFDVRGVYAFGSPRVGDARFKEKYTALGLNGRTYRFVNNQDVVPKVPPPLLYTHVGLLKYIDAAGHVHELAKEADSGVEQHLTANARAWLHGLSFLGHEGFRSLANALTLPIPAPLADHAPVYYASYIWNNVP